MKRRSIVFAPEARSDLLAIYDWVAAAAGPDVALSYLERIEVYCRRLDYAAERGQKRDDIRAGLRVLGFERRVAIAFSVDDTRVTILRLFYGGRYW